MGESGDNKILKTDLGNDDQTHTHTPKPKFSKKDLIHIIVKQRHYYICNQPVVSNFFVLF